MKLDRKFKLQPSHVPGTWISQSSGCEIYRICFRIRDFQSKVEEQKNEKTKKLHEKCEKGERVGPMYFFSPIFFSKYSMHRFADCAADALSVTQYSVA